MSAALLVSAVTLLGLATATLNGESVQKGRSPFADRMGEVIASPLLTIVDDPTDGFERNAIFKRWCEVDTMDDAWIEDLEMGGPGLASEMMEGQEIPSGTIREGFIKRYIARKFG